MRVRCRTQHRISANLGNMVACLRHGTLWQAYWHELAAYFLYKIPQNFHKSVSSGSHFGEEERTCRQGKRHPLASKMAGCRHKLVIGFPALCSEKKSDRSLIGRRDIRRTINGGLCKRLQPNFSARVFVSCRFNTIYRMNCMAVMYLLYLSKLLYVSYVHYIYSS